MFRLVTLLIYKVLKLCDCCALIAAGLVTLLIYKVLKPATSHSFFGRSLVTLLIYKVLKHTGTIAASPMA